MQVHSFTYCVICRLFSKRAKEEQQLAQQQLEISSAVAMTSVTMPPQLAGNLNAAFAESTLTLSADVDKQQQDKENQSPSTVIIVERY